jgi:hypothetical protein
LELVQQSADISKDEFLVAGVVHFIGHDDAVLFVVAEPSRSSLATSQTQ